jgi:hypothetical protein
VLKLEPPLKLYVLVQTNRGIEMEWEGGVAYWTISGVKGTVKNLSGFLEFPPTLFN